MRLHESPALNTTFPRAASSPGLTGNTHVTLLPWQQRPAAGSAHLQGRQHVQGVQGEQPQRLQQHRELVELPRQAEDEGRHENGEKGQPLETESPCGTHASLVKTRLADEFSGAARAPQPRGRPHAVALKPCCTCRLSSTCPEGHLAQEHPHVVREPHAGTKAVICQVTSQEAWLKNSEFCGNCGFAATT